MTGGRTLAAALLLTGGVFLALGWSAGIVPAGPAGAPAPDLWTTPPMPAPAAGRDLADLQAMHPWSAEGRGGMETAGSQPIASGPAGWRLAGTIRRNDEWLVLLARGNAVEYRKPGDRLPDGTIVLQVDRDSVITGPGGSSTDKTIHTLFGIGK